MLKRILCFLWFCLKLTCLSHIFLHPHQNYYRFDCTFCVRTRSYREVFLWFCPRLTCLTHIFLHPHQNYCRFDCTFCVCTGSYIILLTLSEIQIIVTTTILYLSLSASFKLCMHTEQKGRWTYPRWRKLLTLMYLLEVNFINVPTF